MKWIPIALPLLFLLPLACDFRSREAELEKRETALDQKREELNLKEKTLRIKESELLKREQKIDSNIRIDTAHLYNPAIIGVWSVRMTCTEATCTGSAVGDTKNEQWNISFEANTIIARAMSDEKLVRTYTGIPKQDVIELTAQPNEVSTPSARMIVRITLTGSRLMEGQREIIRDNCRVVYALQMEKSSNTELR